MGDPIHAHEINRDPQWGRGDTVSFNSHGFLRNGIIIRIDYAGGYSGTFVMDLDKPVNPEMMSLFQYGKDRRIETSPIRGTIVATRVLLSEKTLWPFYH